MSSCKDLKAQIMEVLLWMVVEDEVGTTITHRELSRALPKSVLAINIPRYLDSMAYYFLLHKLPLLPVLVVNEKTKFPSAWFQRLYEQFYDGGKKTCKELYEQELDRIYEFDGWSQIASRLELDENLVIRLMKRRHY